VAEGGGIEGLFGEQEGGEGKRSEAAAKYDEALKYAPNWQALKTARGALGKA
jgi:hypothetical protein